MPASDDAQTSLAPIRIVTRSGSGLRATAFWAWASVPATFAPVTASLPLLGGLFAPQFMTGLMALIRRQTELTAVFVPVAHEFAGTSCRIAPVWNPRVIESPSAVIELGGPTLAGVAAWADGAAQRAARAAGASRALADRRRRWGDTASPRVGLGPSGDRGVMSLRALTAPTGEG